MKTTVTITVRDSKNADEQLGRLATISVKGDSLTRESAEALANGCNKYVEVIKRRLAIEENLIEMKKKRKFMRDEGVITEEYLDLLLSEGFFCSGRNPDLVLIRWQSRVYPHSRPPAQLKLFRSKNHARQR